MQTSISEVTAITIIVSTLLILIFGAIIIYFLFVYQRKRFRHQVEMEELKKAFTQTLLVSKLEIQEQTLDHISKELHANFSQLVSLININLSEIVLQSSLEKIKESATETKALAKQLLAELKALSASLNTDHIMHLGFMRAIENELSRLSKTRRYEVVFTKRGEEFRLSPDREIILFRLCQEVINNIVKYAKASVINVSCAFENNRLILSIQDNGGGFDIEAAKGMVAEKESTGLMNIEKRAKIINALFFIKSEIKVGTVVTIDIPKN